ncbi:acyl dehydratase [Rhodopseudomonas rhenobacensis]|uniref:Acyl dehydratase n=2 Tax=Rhodopseudomonas rhenobacensis TaxID=87461 RepID=A0A7W8DYV6_9BRAD|nr:acyl dehydratase [Rhodopseudomonas rhenobacensis]
MMTVLPEPYGVVAHNSAKQSENRMHDDAVARRFGFVGGLVPGVDVLAYMTHLPVAKWGRGFLERGLIEARFVKPVYDGDDVEVSAEPDGEGLTLRVESRGELCATGAAALPEHAPPARLGNFRAVPPVTIRRPVDSSSYELGKWLGTAPQCWAGDAAIGYLAEVREADPIYRAEGLLHPGVLQRIMNRVLIENALLGAWMHVGSEMQLLNAARPTDQLTARAKVTGNYEKKGHRIVELDALIVAGGDTAIAHCHHVAIYQPRAKAAA